MDFDSPDVAKDFPGLARATDAIEEYDDKEKSKKKKEKKDSKKDKEKGYAMLADSPDEGEVGDSKSPGKVIKIKAFRLSSKKKDKDKEKKESSSKPHDKVHRKSSSPDKDIKKVEEERKKSLPEKLMSEAVTAALAVVESTAQQQPVHLQRRPFDGQGYKSSTTSSSSTTKSSSKKVKLGPSSTTTSASSLPSAEKSSRGLNVFLNAPVPLLLKKKEKDKSKDKDKEAKKEHSRVKLKLKRGSKSSLEETPSSGGEANQGVTFHPQLPEDPEVISKEIRKYEVLLEQTHAQIKSGKKVSKKSEELWELQRTLTQLKRKLRSVNALSASYANPPTATSAAASKTSSSSESSEKNTNNPPTAHVMPSPTTPPISTTAATSLPNEEVPLDLTPRAEIVQRIPEPKDSNVILAVKTEQTISIEQAEAASDMKNAESSVPESQPPIAEEESEIHETLQVQVEVHSISAVSQENPTPEDIFEQEIQSFPKTSPSVAIGRREKVNVIEKGKHLLGVQDTPESGKSKSEDPATASGEDSTNRVTSDLRSSEIDQDDGDYVFLKIDPNLKHQSQPQDDQSQPIKNQSTKKVVTAPSIFDPFALPEFKTDEFIAAENEALLLFNQQLQDDIVREEEEINMLIKRFQELAAEKEANTKSDLLSLDDDELVNLWQVVKLENDTLNEQVLNLKSMVANSKLEEFRLETRVNYLREKMHGEVSVEEEIQQLTS